MADFFPIPKPAQLPRHLAHCPIVEAVLEIRFVTSEAWSVLPGLLYTRIRDRYGNKRELPLGGLPEEFRRHKPEFTYLPLLQFLGEHFLIQLGPRMVSLNTLSGSYPGWTAISEELNWLLCRLKEAGFVDEGERLGLRYIDFFATNLFPQLLLSSQVAGNPLGSAPLLISTVLRRGPFTVHLHVSNNTTLNVPGEEQPKIGSILDLDASIGAMDFELFQNAPERFSEAHSLVTEAFFGLLAPSFADSLARPTHESLGFAMPGKRARRSR